MGPHLALIHRLPGLWSGCPETRKKVDCLTQTVGNRLGRISRRAKYGVQSTKPRFWWRIIVLMDGLGRAIIFSLEAEQRDSMLMLLLLSF